uniref:Uncharacterized protein n=1 Tax=Arundo donax TaxID=35708 RepID=A0A0A9B503_ARUDO
MMVKIVKAILTALELPVLTYQRFQIKERATIVMKYRLQVVVQMIMSAQMLGPFKMARMATSCQAPSKNVGAEWMNSMNQVYT